MNTTTTSTLIPAPTHRRTRKLAAPAAVVGAIAVSLGWGVETASAALTYNHNEILLPHSDRR